MYSRLSNARLLVAVAIAATLAACARTESPTSPAGPSPTSGTSPVTGMTIVGVVAGSTGPSARTADSVAGMTVSIEGTTIIATVDLSGRFELRNVPAGDVRLRFNANGVDARVTLVVVDNPQRIEITVTITATTATVDKDTRTWPDNKVEIEGRISATDATAKTFEIDGKTIAVTADTVIRHGSTPVLLADLAVGDRVHVRGTVSGTTVTAVEIMVQNQKPVPAPISVSGTVASPSGSCPALTFTIGSAIVITTAQTDYVKGACADIKAGVSLDLKGVVGSDATITATWIKF